MEKLQGITASTGIAIGVTCLYSDELISEVPHYMIHPKGVETELRRLESAFEKAKRSIQELSGASEVAGDPESVKGLIRAHLMMIEDPDLRAKAGALVSEKFMNAEHAVEDAFEEYSSKLFKKAHHFSEITHDLDDVKTRVIASFKGAEGKFECPVGERQPVIVVAKRLSPSMVLSIPRENVLAFLTEEGGLTTHASILARSYNVPVVYGIDVKKNISCGQKAIVDAALGLVFLDPDEATKKEYQKKLRLLKERKASCDARRPLPPSTREGLRIGLKVNITALEELELMGDMNYDGIGLLRTEFLFKNKNSPPNFQEQYRSYKRILDLAGDKPVTIRILDIAADKMPSYMHLPPQENPDLGIRGARAAEIFKEIYVTQMKAVLHASNGGRVGLLYPMVSDLSDIDSFRKLLGDARKELADAGLDHDAHIREGIMIETPAAALNAETLLEQVDFANLGTNDLLQYTLAASRGSRFVEDRYHVMHPALVRLMRIASEAGNKEKKEVCLCGEIGSFEKFYPLMLGIGIRSFSVPAAVYEDLKCHIFYKDPLDHGKVREFLKLKGKTEIDDFFARSLR